MTDYESSEVLKAALAEALDRTASLEEKLARVKAERDGAQVRANKAELAHRDLASQRDVAIARGAALKATVKEGVRLIDHADPEIDEATLLELVRDELTSALRPDPASEVD